MELVLVVTSGEYDDYEIEAIFSTEAAAINAIKSGIGDAIEAYALDELSPQQDDRPTKWRYEYRLEDDTLEFIDRTYKGLNVVWNIEIVVDSSYQWLTVQSSISDEHARELLGRYKPILSERASQAAIQDLTES